MKFYCIICSLFAVVGESFGINEIQHVEARQTRPLAISSDGTRLFALNSAESRLSVFSIEGTALDRPQLIAEIPVGLVPVSVVPRTLDEIWVVNELSDSISIVSVAEQMAVASIPVGDEPSDLVFVGNKAYVTCARVNSVQVIDVATRQVEDEIELSGLVPTAVEASVDGSRIFVCFLHSGNNTTTLPANIAPAPPAPTNPALPPAPQTGLIVSDSHPSINYDVIDHDIAEINVATRSVVRYFGNAGTNLFSLAVTANDEVWVSGTDAKNLIRFEPALNGIFAENRLARLNLATGQVGVIVDLNPTLTQPVEVVAQKATALAQPMRLLSVGPALWVAAFGSDRVAKIDPQTGAVVARVDLRNPGETTEQMRGPRGLAHHGTHNRLYVSNKLHHTISTVDSAGGVVLSEVALGSHDPLPQNIREGRGYFYDARLSGNGTVSCAICHLDADRDGIAWDLGDPGGEMVVVTNQFDTARLHSPTPVTREMHPMKGPMVTQTLRGIKGGAPFHWRGDRPDLASFNQTFPKLLAGSEISTEDMKALSDYIESLVHHPNPNLKLDGTPDESMTVKVAPGDFRPADAVMGRIEFIAGAKHCIECHSESAPTDSFLGTGSSGNIDEHDLVSANQPIKDAPLRLIYQKDFANFRSGQESLSGYGFNHDGTGFVKPIGHEYGLALFQTVQEFLDVAAFMVSFPTGTPPAVGHEIMLVAGEPLSPAQDAEWTILENLSAQPTADTGIDLIVRGRWQGKLASFLFNPGTNSYDGNGSSPATISKAELQAQMASGDRLIVYGVLRGQGPWLARDRDCDGILDGHEPSPLLTIAPHPAGGFHLNWSADQEDWFLLSTPDLVAPWSLLPTAGTEITIDGTAPSQFFRIQRTW